MNVALDAWLVSLGPDLGPALVLLLSFVLVVIVLILAVNRVLRPVAAWIDRHRAGRQPEDDVLDG